jgi:glycosyltransferase involved in cell wall biosynthesis
MFSGISRDCSSVTGRFWHGPRNKSRTRVGLPKSGLRPSDAAGEGFGSKAHRPRPLVLLYVTTVPQSLLFLTGQPGYMRARGFEVHALSSPKQRNSPDACSLDAFALDAFAEREQVPVHAVELTRRITPLRDLGAIVRLWRRLRRLRPDIVHAHTPKGGLLGMVGAWLARVPVRIYHIHGLPLMTATGYKRLLLGWSERISCRLAHQVFCVSHSVREIAIAQGLCPAAKIRVLLRGSINGVDARGRFDPAGIDEDERREMRERYGIPAGAPVLGFVGRIVRDKGVVELAEAWKILREEISRLHLLVVGPFEPQDPVPPHVAELLHNDPRIHLTGDVESDNMPPLYSVMDLVALPTYREGFNGVCLEATSMGLPVVATRIPGCLDVIEDGVTGTLIPPRDARALAAAIRVYLQDRGLRIRHGQAGRERALRDYCPEDIWGALHREYTRLLQERGLDRSQVG